MPSAIDAARYLVELAFREEEPDGLTHLRLQKLLFYVQGWHLAVFQSPLFEGRIEGWKHGPVVRDLYQEFKSFGDQIITPAALGTATVPRGVDRLFLESFWEEYKKYSTSALVDLTHQEPLWLKSREGLRPKDLGDREITAEDMLADFTTKMESKLLPGLPPREVYSRAMKAEEEGVQLLSHEEVFSGLGSA